MMDETKEIIYTVLDFLDSMSKTSKSDQNLIHVNNETLSDVQNELFALLKYSKDDRHGIIVDKKTELIGILPSVLADKDKFPNNKDIAKLAEKSLNYSIPFWGKRSRNEIIGSIVAKIVEEDEYELETFLEPWREFIKEEISDKFEVQDKHNEFGIKGNEDFVNVWLEFFDHYKGK